MLGVKLAPEPVSTEAAEERSEALMIKLVLFG